MQPLLNAFLKRKDYSFRPLPSGVSKVTQVVNSLQVNNREGSSSQ
jgi:hypothetical protein